MDIKTKKKIALILLICIISALVLSLSLVLSDSHHGCISGHCQMCSLIHNLEFTLKSLFEITGIITAGLLFLANLVSILYFISFLRNEHRQTPVGQKIRLNY